MNDSKKHTLTSGEITQLLQAWNNGEKGALDRLFPVVYEELRSSARRHLRGGSSHTLQPTAVVNEVYLRMCGNAGASFGNRAQFFAFMAKTIRSVLVDHARAHLAEKRGSGAVRLELDERLGLSTNENVDLNTMVALDRALDEMAADDARLAKIVEMRFFAGFSILELADFLSLSEATIHRELRIAKRRLAVELGRARVS